MNDLIEDKVGDYLLDCRVNGWEVTAERIAEIVVGTLGDPVVAFYGYPVAEAIAIIQRAEDAGLTDKSLRTWQDKSRG